MGTMGPKGEKGNPGMKGPAGICDPKVWIFIKRTSHYSLTLHNFILHHRKFLY